MKTIKTTSIELYNKDIILGYNPFGISGSEYIVKIKSDNIITIYNKSEMMDIYGLSYVDIDYVQKILSENTSQLTDN